MFASKTILALSFGLMVSAATWAAAASPPGKEEVAKCEAMIKEMGAAVPHSHGADKGQGPAPMSAEHARCNAILAEAGKAPPKK